MYQIEVVRRRGDSRHIFSSEKPEVFKFYLKFECCQNNGRHNEWSWIFETFLKTADIDRLTARSEYVFHWCWSVVIVCLYWRISWFVQQERFLNTQTVNHIHSTSDNWPSFTASNNKCLHYRHVQHLPISWPFIFLCFFLTVIDGLFTTVSWVVDLLSVFIYN